MPLSRIIRLATINLMVGLAVAMSACTATTPSPTAVVTSNPTIVIASNPTASTTPDPTTVTKPNPTASTTPNPTGGTKPNPTATTRPIKVAKPNPTVDTVKLTKLSSDTDGIMFIPCPANEVVIAGGWNFAVTNQFIPHDDAPSITESYPANNGWIIGFEPGNPPVSVTAYAECLVNAKAQVSLYSTVHDVSADDSDQLTSVECPSGSTLVGGGFKYNDPHFFWLIGSIPSGNFWFVTFKNRVPTSYPAGFYDYVLCYGAVVPIAQPGGNLTTWVGTDDNATASILAECTKYTPTAGGFQRRDATSLVFGDSPDLQDPSNVQWSVVLFDNGSVSTTGFTANENCVQF